MGLPDTLDELEKLMGEVENLLAVSLDYPRSDDEIFLKEEVQKLKILREKESELLTQLKDLGGDDDEDSLKKYAAQDDMLNSPLAEDPRFDVYTEQEEQKIRKMGALSKDILTLYEAMREILYKKPGVIPEMLYYFKETVERFNTLEQPRIEKLLDDVNLTVQESQKVLSKTNKTVKNTQDLLEDVEKYKTPMIVGLGVFGVLLIAIMAMLLVLLVQIAFF
jgi:hypothetical protein